MKMVRSRYFVFAGAILSMLLISAAFVHKEKKITRQPLLLLQKVTVNGKLTDSIIYNSKGRLAEIWFYDDITGRWDAHNKYVYGDQDRVEKVLEYWGNELMEIDSVCYRNNGFTRYSISRRSASCILTDTLQFLTNEDGRPVQIGSRDTVQYGDRSFITYDAIRYRDDNPLVHAAFDYFPAGMGNGKAYTRHEVISEQEYDSNPNPFSALCQDYPGIAMETFDTHILFADAANNMVRKTITESYSGAGTETERETVICSYRYDPVTQLPLEQSYIRYELDEQDRPVQKKYNIQFYYREQ